MLKLIQIVPLSMSLACTTNAAPATKNEMPRFIDAPFNSEVQQRCIDDMAEHRGWGKGAIAVNAEFTPAYINLGNAQGSLNNFGEAEAAFDKARELAPESYLPVYSLGYLAEQQHKFQEAANYYLDSVNLAPTFESGYFSFAAMYGNLKRFDDAKAALNIVLELDPSAPNAKEMLQQLPGSRSRRRSGASNAAVPRSPSTKQRHPASDGRLFGFAALSRAEHGTALKLVTPLAQHASMISIPSISNCVCVGQSTQFAMFFQGTTIQRMFSSVL